MISRVFLAYIVIALGAVPSSFTTASDADAPGNVAHPSSTANTTLAPSNPGAGHSTAPVSTTTAENTTANPHSDPSAADHPPAAATTNATAAGHPTTPASGSSSPATTPPNAPTDATAAAHPPAPATNPTSADAPKSATANTTAAAHGAAPDASTRASSAPKSVDGNHTAEGHSSTDSQDTKTNTTPVTAHSSEKQADAPSTPTCFPKSKSHGVEAHHCDKALDKVVYAANQTLDKFSSMVWVNYKTCNLHVQKPKNGTLNKADLTSMVHNINAACNSVGGVLAQSPKKITVTVDRATKENVYEVDSPVCKKEKCPLTESDCLSAFFQLPQDSKGVFVNGKGKQPFARVTSGNCTVTASTTDFSAFSIPRQQVLPTMKKLLKDCAEHPGKIYIAGGATGYNGDIRISTRASNKELCE